MGAATITVVKDGGFLGHPQSDMGNVGFNLTDDEALEQLEFNLLWHHALRLDIEETHLPQKTLHNFRVRLMQHDGGWLAFRETTDRIIQA